MTPVKVYGIKNCDSVKKALKFFKAHNIDFELVDFKTTPVDCAKISEWLQTVDLDTLFNKRGTTYRTLGLKDMNLDDSQRKEWLCQENLLIKRPVIEHESGVTVAFNPSEYERVFLS